MQQNIEAHLMKNLQLSVIEMLIDLFKKNDNRSNIRVTSDNLPTIVLEK